MYLIRGLLQRVGLTQLWKQATQSARLSLCLMLELEVCRANSQEVKMDIKWGSWNPWAQVKPTRLGSNPGPSHCLRPWWNRGKPVPFAKELNSHLAPETERREARREGEPWHIVSTSVSCSSPCSDFPSVETKVLRSTCTSCTDRTLVAHSARKHPRKEFWPRWQLHTAAATQGCCCCYFCVWCFHYCCWHLLLLLQWSGKNVHFG